MRNCIAFCFVEDGEEGLRRYACKDCHEDAKTGRNTKRKDCCAVLAMKK